MAKVKIYDGTKWVKPSEVNANPTLAGTETELSGLEIDGVKYKIAAGGGSATGSGALYQHRIIVNDATDDYDFVFLSKQSEPFVDGDSLMGFLTAIGAADDDNVIISPMIKKDGASAAEIVNGMVVNGSIYSVVITTVSGDIIFPFQSNLEIFDTVSTYITCGSGGSGETGTGGVSFEEDTIDFYFSDFSIIASNAILTNTEKLAKVNALIEKSNQNKILIGTVEAPTIEGGGGSLDQRSKVCSANVFAFYGEEPMEGFMFGSNEALFGFRKLIIDNNSYVVPYISTPGDANSQYGEQLLQLLATDSTKYIRFKVRVETETGGSGGGDTPSVTGGSGKLYEFKLRYKTIDNNGNVIKNSSNEDIDVKVVAYFYESNWERFCAQEKNRMYADDETIDFPENPSDFVTFLNNFVTPNNSSRNAYIQMDFLSTFLENADHLFGGLAFNDVTYSNYFYRAFFSSNSICFGISGSNYTNNQFLEKIEFEYDDNNNKYPTIDNSCTLTEYGTSASGSGSGTGTQTIHSNLVVLQYDNICSSDPSPLSILVEREKLDQVIAAVNQQMSSNITVDTLSDAWSNANEYEKRAMINLLGFFMLGGSIYGSAVLTFELEQTTINGQTVYTNAYVVLPRPKDTTSGSGYLLDCSKYELDNIDNSTLTVNLGEQTIQGGGSGGTVEAEPIISIKMTNLDTKNTDSDNQRLMNFQVYMTKTRWNDIVSLAKTIADVDLTYSNILTVFQGMSATEQATFLGALLFEYYDGKVLPMPYLQDANYRCFNLMEAQPVNLQDLGGDIDVDFCFTAHWYNGSSSAFFFPNGADRYTDKFDTQNTVITVEEIAGAAIGSSAGGGGAIYKHNLLVEDVDGLSRQITIVNCKSTDFSSSSLASVLQQVLDGIISAYIDNHPVVDIRYANDNPNNIFIGTSQIIIGNGTASLGNDVVYNIPLSSSVVDVITQLSQGGSGSGGSSESQYDYIQIGFGGSNAYRVVMMFDKAYSRRADMATDVNQLITALNQMASLSIPAYTKLEDLSTIATYINNLDVTYYAAVKVAWWASMWQALSVLALSIKFNDYMDTNGATFPININATAIEDGNNSTFVYSIKYLDDTPSWNTIATEQTVFNFAVFVNQLD